MSLLPWSAEPIVHHLAIYHNIWHMSLVSIFVVTIVATKIFWQELNLSLTRETEEHQACSSPQSCCSIQRYQNQDIHSVDYTIRVTTNSQGSTKSLMYMNADKRKPDTFWSQRDTGQTWERETKPMSRPWDEKGNPLTTCMALWFSGSCILQVLP